MTTNDRRINSLRNKHFGAEAILLGNGPSVRIEDLDRLTDRVTFCCNRFYLSYNKTKLRPNYTISSDQQMIEDFGAEIVRCAGGTVILAHPEKPKLDSPFVWLRYRNAETPFTTSPFEWVFPHGGTLIVALQIGYFMGIRRFVLYGVDHTFKFVPTSNQDHYRTASGEGNHFIPNYRSGRAWCPPWVEGIERAFIAWHQKLLSEGGYLVNATRGGALEVLPRLNFDDFLNGVAVKTVLTE